MISLQLPSVVRPESIRCDLHPARIAVIYLVAGKRRLCAECEQGRRGK
jgi:hypothetical protein